LNTPLLVIPMAVKRESPESPVPIAAQAILYLGPVGLGAMLFANLNTTLPSIGLAGTVNVGRF